MIGSRRGRALAFSRCLKVVVAMTAALAICPDALAAGKRTVEGTIKDYECGDFCHLTVVDARGKEHDALCGAPPCDKIQKTPKRFVGRKVRATVTKDMPVDNDGTIVEVDVFTKIELLR